MPISVILLDDELLARQRLRRLLRQEPDVEVVGEEGQPAQALELVRRERPDVVLLDVEMPGMSGVEIADELATLPDSPLVVFVTAHASFAPRAFQASAIDYLLKPVEPAQLRATMERVRSRLTERAAAAMGRRLEAFLAQLGEAPGDGAASAQTPLGSSGARRPFLDRITVKSAERVIFVKVDDVDYLEAEANYVLVRVGKTVHRIRSTLSALEASLNPSHFVRIHRQTIVNVDRIKEMVPWFTGDYVIRLRDGTELRMSRTYRPTLDAAFYHRGE